MPMMRWLSPAPVSSSSRVEPWNSFLRFFLKEEAFLAAAWTRTLFDLGFGGEEGGEYLTFSVTVACRDGTERERRVLLLFGPVGICSDLFTAVGCLTMALVV